MQRSQKVFEDVDLQLSRSSLHSCSSIGYLVRSISHATVEVILEAACELSPSQTVKTKRQSMMSLLVCAILQSRIDICGNLVPVMCQSVQITLKT